MDNSLVDRGIFCSPSIKRGFVNGQEVHGKVGVWRIRIVEVYRFNRRFSNFKGEIRGEAVEC